MRIFLAGPPLTCGGGNVEAGDSALLWRGAGLDVTCLYFERCKCGKKVHMPEGSNPWVDRLARAGIDFEAAPSGQLHDVEGLPGSIVVGFCHSHLLHNWPELKSIGCRMIWSPCMCFRMLDENEALKDMPPTAVHFQSRYQMWQSVKDYEGWGCEEFAHIPGAFSQFRYNPRPHKPGEPFVIGRLARPDRMKWNPHLWDILKAVRASGVDVRALCQGWSEELDFHCGEPPGWATCLPQDELSSEEFLGRCHAMIAPNWGVNENWPRIGLEAMSAGVPLVVDSRGGWIEMLGDGYDSLCEKLGDYVPALVDLAQDEERRMDAIRYGRARVERITDPEPIAEKWLELFSKLVTP
jgi:glycosyltransferase involved in cell wall biosynthesis